MFFQNFSIIKEVDSMARAAAGNGNLRKRPNGTWEGRFVAGIDPATGKSIRKSVYGKTQKEVREKLRAATAAIDEGTYFEPTKATVNQWLEEWLDTYTGDLKPLTLDAYQRQLRNNVIPHLGAVPLASLSAPQVQKLYNSLQGGEYGKSLSPKTIKNLHGILHRCLKQAVNIGLIRTNPTDAVTVPRVPRQEVQPLEGDMVSKFMVAVQSDRYRLVYLIDLYTGMRLGEILGLTWGCVNFARGTITVKQQLQKEKKKPGRFYFAPLKNDRTRTITVAPSVIGFLAERKAEQAEQRLAAGQSWDKTGDVFTDSTCTVTALNSDLVFTDPLGKHLVGGTVYKHCRSIGDKIGFSGLRVHDLRHSFAVASLENGDDVKTVQSNLGHATAAFTLDKYGHVSETMRRNSANRMEQYIQRASGGAEPKG
jgi:integrase